MKRSGPPGRLPLPIRLSDREYLEFLDVVSRSLDPERVRRQKDMEERMVRRFSFFAERGEKVVTGTRS